MATGKTFPDLPPVWAAVFFAGEWLAARFLPLAGFGAPLSAALGLVLAVAGFAIALWAAIWFGRKKTAIEPGMVPRALIVEGPFRLNRNPIYTGMTLVLVGIALWLGTLGSLLVAFGFPILVTARFIRDEEAMLRQAFGPEADRYFAVSRRW